MSCNETVLIGVELNLPGANYHFGRCLSPVSLAQSHLPRLVFHGLCTKTQAGYFSRASHKAFAMQAMKAIWNVEIAPSSN